VDINWTDGPTDDQVNKITKKYQYGHFDGMIDCYEYSNNREDIPQAKFVMCSRELSDEIILKTAKTAKKHYSDLENIEEPQSKEDLSKSFSAFNDYINWHQLAYKILREIDLTEATGIISDPEFTGGTMFSGFIITKGETNVL